MDTIFKQVEVGYHRPTTAEIIKMIPVMDELAGNYKLYNRWIKEINSGKSNDSTPVEVYIDKANAAYSQLCILANLGFYTSNTNKEIVSPEELI